MIVLTGTDKGLVEYSVVDGKPNFERIHFLGFKVGCINFHKDSNTLRVAINHKHWGPKIHLSKDFGETWKELSCPAFPEDALKMDGKKASLRSIWNILGINDSESFLVGTEPAALFHTSDNGKSYSLVRSLWDHPSRKMWMGGGKGSTQPFLHTILEDPENTNHYFIGISAGGVFESDDSGNTWKPINSGVKADFLPDFDVDAGHDPHTVRICPSDPNVIWQQNHCGIYRSEDKGKNWIDISGEGNKPYYGFGLVVDELDDKKAWVIPAESDDLRFPYNNSLEVYFTEDGGKKWAPRTKGLPPPPNFDLVFRQAFEKKDDLMVFGSNNGNLYFSIDEGEHWNTISQNLAPVRCIHII